MSAPTLELDKGPCVCGGPGPVRCTSCCEDPAAAGELKYRPCPVPGGHLWRSPRAPGWSSPGRRKRFCPSGPSSAQPGTVFIMGVPSLLAPHIYSCCSSELRSPWCEPGLKGGEAPLPSAAPRALRAEASSPQRAPRRALRGEVSLPSAARARALRGRLLSPARVPRRGTLQGCIRVHRASGQVGPAHPQSGVLCPEDPASSAWFTLQPFGRT